MFKLRFYLFIVLLLFFYSFPQNKNNFIKVATIDLDYIFKKLNEDPYMLKMLVSRGEESYEEIANKGNSLYIAKQKLLDIKSLDKRQKLELEISQLEMELNNYFSRVPKYNAMSDKALNVIYEVIENTAKMKGVSLLIEKNASVVYSSEEAEITLDVWNFFLNLKKRMGF